MLFIGNNLTIGYKTEFGVQYNNLHNIYAQNTFHILNGYIYKKL